jgi:hypothetical protein
MPEDAAACLDAESSSTAFVAPRRGAHFWQVRI